MKIFFSQVETYNDSVRVFTLREENYKNNSPYLLCKNHYFHPGQDELDQYAYLFQMKDETDKTLATCRFLPLRNNELSKNECFLRNYSQHEDVRRINALQPLQISRLIVEENYRNYYLAELLICFSYQWLLKNTSSEYFCAICFPPLARFYKHFGAEVVPDLSIHLLDRSDKPYKMIYGDMRKGMRILEEYLTGKNWKLGEFAANIITSHAEREKVEI